MAVEITSLECVAKTYDIPLADVETMWQQYCTDCRNYDQSPLIHEFVSWYKMRLNA